MSKICKLCIVENKVVANDINENVFSFLLTFSLLFVLSNTDFTCSKKFLINSYLKETSDD